MLAAITNAERLIYHLKCMEATRKIHEAYKYAQNNKCPICFEIMEEYVEPPCKHRVCTTCFKKNSETIYGNKCCLCRADV